MQIAARCNELCWGALVGRRLLGTPREGASGQGFGQAEVLSVEAVAGVAPADWYCCMNWEISEFSPPPP